MRKILCLIVLFYMLLMPSVSFADSYGSQANAWNNATLTGGTINFSNAVYVGDGKVITVIGNLSGGSPGAGIIVYGSKDNVNFYSMNVSASVTGTGDFAWNGETSVDYIKLVTFSGGTITATVLSKH